MLVGGASQLRRRRCSIPTVASRFPKERKRERREQRCFIYQINEHLNKVSYVQPAHTVLVLENKQSWAIQEDHGPLVLKNEQKDTQ
jgi:hypothetical protein